MGAWSLHTADIDLYLSCLWRRQHHESIDIAGLTFLPVFNRFCILAQTQYYIISWAESDHLSSFSPPFSGFHDGHFRVWFPTLVFVSWIFLSLSQNHSPSVGPDGRTKVLWVALQYSMVQHIYGMAVMNMVLFLLLISLCLPFIACSTVQLSSTILVQVATLPYSCPSISDVSDHKMSESRHRRTDSRRDPAGQASGNVARHIPGPYPPPQSCPVRDLNDTLEDSTYRTSSSYVRSEQSSIYSPGPSDTSPQYRFASPSENIQNMSQVCRSKTFVSIAD